MVEPAFRPVSYCVTKGDSKQTLTLGGVFADYTLGDSKLDMGFPLISNTRWEALYKSDSKVGEFTMKQIVDSDRGACPTKAPPANVKTNH